MLERVLSLCSQFLQALTPPAARQGCAAGRCCSSWAYLGSGTVLEPSSHGCAEIAAAVDSIGEWGDFAHHGPVDDASVRLSIDA